MNFITKFLDSYGFDGPKDFLFSLFPSFRYGIQIPAISLSAVVAVFSEFLGFSPVIVFVMFMAVIVETLTGIRASTKSGHPFESFKFSRCIIKVVIWCFLFFMFHSFSNDMAEKTGWMFAMGVVLFDIMHVTTMVYFCVEYGTSILENFAVLDGKPKETLINAIKETCTSMINQFKSHKNE